MEEKWYKKNFLLMATLFVAIVTSPMILSFMVKSQESAEDRRNLAPKPSLPQTLGEATAYTTALGRYVSDHFPLRGSLLEIHHFIFNKIFLHAAASGVLRG